MIRNDRVPGLNFPYCVATILLLGALHGFSGLGAGTVGHASPLSLGTHVYASDTWLYGIGTGISQIFLQDNWLTGIVLVAAIAVNDPCFGRKLREHPPDHILRACGEPFI